MVNYEWIGFVIVFFVGLFLVAVPMSQRLPRRVGRLLIAAFFLRAFGSLLRHWILYNHYRGVGDATGYYNTGVRYAASIWDLDFTFLDPDNFYPRHWWGTQAVKFVSGFIIAVSGPSMRGEFFIFSLFSFLGLYLFCKSFHANYPQQDCRHYARWVLLWPSLWYWPSTVGKDALILLATGLVIYGYAGRLGRVRWFALVSGCAIAAAIRPHVAAILAVSVLFAYWTGIRRRWNAARILQGILVIGLCALVLHQSLISLGLESRDLEAIKEFTETKSEKSVKGGSAVQAPGLGLSSIPLGLVNVMFRPFPWESTGLLPAIASLEMIVFWGFVLYRRRRIIAALRQWRSSPLLRFSIPVAIFYILMLGLYIGNLGIIARHRIHVMPLLFLWFEIPLQRYMFGKTKTHVAVSASELAYRRESERSKQSPIRNDKIQ